MKTNVGTVRPPRTNERWLFCLSDTQFSFCFLSIRLRIYRPGTITNMNECASRFETSASVILPVNSAGLRGVRNQSVSRSQTDPVEEPNSHRETPLSSTLAAAQGIRLLSLLTTQTANDRPPVVDWPSWSLLNFLCVYPTLISTTVQSNRTSFLLPT